MKPPVVGTSVHYVAYGTPGGEFPAGVCRAATITENDPDGATQDVGLCVMNPSGLFFNRGLGYDESKKPGTWHFVSLHHGEE